MYILLLLLYCIQWTVAELSSHAYSRVVVALYDTLGKEAMAHIINQGK